MTPLDQLAADRKRASAARDPWAGLCVLATVDAGGIPQARTLVLRDIDERLGVFVNSTSPKVLELPGSSHVSVLTYLASIGVQYRLRTTLQQIDAATVASNWQLRPPIPKAMDWIYTNHQPQSTPVVTRDVLVALQSSVAATLGVQPVAPVTAVGYYLNIDLIERLELSADVVHDRRRYTLVSGAWTEVVLVP